MPLEIAYAPPMNQGFGQAAFQYGAVGQDERNRQAALEAQLRVRQQAAQEQQQAFGQNLATANYGLDVARFSHVAQQAAANYGLEAAKFQAAQAPSARDIWQDENQAKQMEQQFKLRSWLSEQELSQAEKLRLQRLEGQLSFIRERAPTELGGNNTLTQEEFSDALMFLNTGIEPLRQRMQTSAMLHTRMQTQQMQTQMDHQLELWNRQQQYMNDPANFQFATIPHPVTGVPTQYHVRPDGSLDPVPVQMQLGLLQNQLEHTRLENERMANQNQPDFVRRQDAVRAWHEASQEMIAEERAVPPGGSPPAWAATQESRDNERMRRAQQRLGAQGQGEFRHPQFNQSADQILRFNLANLRDMPQQEVLQQRQVQPGQNATLTRPTLAAATAARLQRVRQLYMRYGTAANMPPVAQAELAALRQQIEASGLTQGSLFQNVEEAVPQISGASRTTVPG